MNEIAWDWPEIVCVLMWKLAPKGVVITRKDLAALPIDRVLKYDRLADRMIFRFVPPQPGPFEELQGRWQKIAVVLLWKLAKDGVTLGQWDRDTVPADKTLLAHGHEQDIEYRFVQRAEAIRIAKWEKDNEGKMVLEAV
jgi:hypothetical protein